MLELTHLPFFPWSGFGDIPFKQPPAFTRRILYNLLPGFHNISPWEEFLVRNKTPPYVTAEPEITHRRLDVPVALTRTSAGGVNNPKLPFNLLGRSGSRSASPTIPTTAAAPPSSSSSAPVPSHSRFLILASDGFADLCQREGHDKILTNWANGMMSSQPGIGVSDAETGTARDNMALRLLRRAIGGEDRYGVSKVLTLEMDSAWIDDTSIVVQTL